jgi:hypothetical protein
MRLKFRAAAVRTGPFEPMKITCYQKVEAKPDQSTSRLTDQSIDGPADRSIVRLAGSPVGRLCSWPAVRLTCRSANRIVGWVLGVRIGRSSCRLISRRSGRSTKGAPVD